MVDRLRSTVYGPVHGPQSTIYRDRVSAGDVGGIPGGTGLGDGGDSGGTVGGVPGNGGSGFGLAGEPGTSGCSGDFGSVLIQH